MKTRVGQAMEQALAYHRVPTRLSGAHGRPLPEGMITLLRLAGGDQAMVTQCAQASGETEQDVVCAAVFFIQQVMFAPGTDSYRTLGVDAQAPDARIKEHYRWLVRWLHPDRNTDDWDNVYADRINVAWQDLRSPDRRQAYDQSRLAGMAVVEENFGDASIIDRVPVSMPRPAPAAAVPVPEPDVSTLSAATAQKLPTLVLGGLGGAAVALLFLMWLASDPHDLRGGGQGSLVSTGTAPAPRPLALEERPDAMAAAQPPAPASMQAAQIASAVAEAMSPFGAPAVPSSSLPKAGGPPPPARAAESAPVTARVQPAAAPPASKAQAPAPPPAAVAPAVAPAAVAAQPVAPRPEPLTTVATAAPAVPAKSLPAATTATDSPPTPTSAPMIAETQGHALLRGFSDAYRAGDISRLMRLFTADARNNRGGRDAIVYDYQSLFSASQSRDLRLEPSGWLQRGDGATLTASYEARVRIPGRRREEVSRGSIRFDLRLENGEPRISLVLHD